MKLSHFSLVFLLFLSACTSSVENKENTTEAEAPKQESTNPPKVNFVCKDISSNPEEMPQFEVSLEIGDKIQILDSISACKTFTKEEYAQHEIPANALSACGGWWAGAGDYLYVIEENKAFIVMQGWQDEQQEDKGYHYKEMKRIEW